MSTRRRTHWTFNFTALMAILGAGMAVFAFFYLYSNVMASKDYQAIYNKWHEYVPNNYFNTHNGRLFPFHSENDSLTNTQRRLLIFAFDCYQEKQFDPASPFLASDNFLKAMNIDEMKQHPGIFFFYTLSLQEQGQTLNAILNFEYLTGLGNDFTYHDEVKWNLALLMIKDNRPKEATPILEELMQKDSSYKEKAGELLKDI